MKPLKSKFMRESIISAVKYTRGSSRYFKLIMSCQMLYKI